MTAAETEVQDSQQQLLTREVSINAEVGDGRTLDMRVVGFDDIGIATDPPLFRPYREQFMRGAFANQGRALHRILLTYEHRQTLDGVLGHAVDLHERSDGYYATFTIHDNADGDKALTMLREKIFEHGSMEFEPLRTVRTRDGIVQRVKARLDKLTLTRGKPSFSSTAVLGLREQAETIIDENLLPPEIDPELLERCRRLGIRLPERYQTHPAEPDTSAESDTSADGTRQPTVSTDS